MTWTPSVANRRLWGLRASPRTLTLLFYAGTAGTAVSGIWMGREGFNPLIILLLLFCLGLPLYVDHLKRLQAQMNQEMMLGGALSVESRQIMAMGSILKPCVLYLVRMALQPQECDKEYGSLLTKVVDAAASLCGPDNKTRGVFFLGCGDDGPPSMVVAEYSGTVHPSARVFTDAQADVAGRSAWAFLKNNTEPKLWPDLDTEAPEGYTQSTTGRNYKTFICAPVRGFNGDAFGLLNVDAMQPGELVDSDRATMAMLAAVMGAACSLRQDARRRGSVGAQLSYGQGRSTP